MSTCLAFVDLVKAFDKFPREVGHEEKVGGVESQFVGQRKTIHKADCQWRSIRAWCMAMHSLEQGCSS